MKKLFMKAAVACLAMAMCVSFASCGDDDNEEEVVSDAVVTAKSKFELNLNESWFEYFTITATYVGADGETRNATINQYQWGDTIIAPTDGSKKTISFKLIATPKPNITIEDSSKEYLTGNYSFKMVISGYKKDGSENISYGMKSSISSNEPITGKKINKKMTDGAYIPIDTSISSCEVE